MTLVAWESTSLGRGDYRYFASHVSPCAPRPDDYTGHDSLRVVTISVWSGPDYLATLRFDEYELMERREKRFDLLVRGLRRLTPDVVFI